MPTQEYNSIMGFLVTRNNSSNICGLTPENQIACQCNSTHHFGSIMLDFGNKSYFNINLEDIIDYFPTENYQCVFGIGRNLHLFQPIQAKSHQPQDQWSHFAHAIIEASQVIDCNGLIFLFLFHT